MITQLFVYYKISFVSMKDYVGQAIMMILVSNGCQGDLSREKGEEIFFLQQMIIHECFILPKINV